MNHASCLCKSIQFTIDCELHSTRYCYCTNCTKFAGTSPATWAIMESSKLTVTSAEKSVSKFDSGRGRRCFCPHCGSPVWFESLDNPELLAIPLGVLDDGDVPAPERHIWVRSKPKWCTIHDHLPQHKTDP